MITIQHDVQLKSLNTLSLDSVASYYVQIHSKQDLIDALAFAHNNHLELMILSGGSNLLLPEKIDALVIHIDLQGIEFVSEDESSKTLRVSAGQSWHEFVLWTTEHKLYGLQNLALIPGRVGASPVQNIGAYGVEVGEFIDTVEVYDRELKCFSAIAAQDCGFAYRHSIFKEQPSRYVIVAVVFKLLKSPQMKINYGDLKAAMGDEMTPDNLQTQVIAIRQSKLPDPTVYPNAGSFFKNPIMSLQDYERLAALFPHVPHYLQANGDVKVAAGWLIDQSGWKGKRLDKVGMFDKQALVLVNYADAKLHDVQATYRAVQKDVLNKFNVFLEPEPVLIDIQGLIRSHQRSI